MILLFVWFCVLAMITIRLSEAVTEYLWRRSLQSLTHHVAFNLMNTFYRRLLKLSFSWFNRAHTGDIMSRATNDIQEVRGALEFGLSFFVRNVILLIGALVIMFSVNLQLAILTFAPLMVITFITRFILPKIYRLSLRVQEQMAALSTHAQENFSGIRVVKAYATEEIEKRRFGELSEEFVNRNMQMVYLRAYMAPMFMTIMMICPLLILWFGGQYIIKGEFTVGDLFMFLAYQQMMLWPMMAFGMVLARLQRGGAAMARINRIMSISPEIRDDERTGPDMKIKGEIEFRDMSFRYEDSGFALENINLRIPAGATVGIVGPVGSGKSTLVSLVMRLFDIPDDKLFIDNRDINTIPVNRLRSSTGYVPQDSFLFSETIGGTISFGNPDIDFAQVVEAARIARVTDDIEGFSDKYDQLIGERGVTLSGGQKQRVAMARAIALNPSILILDDSLSSVDMHTEEAILQGLRRFFKERTTLIVSHRISTVAAADFIIVLDKGRVIEQGTHSQLIEKGGLYASIYQKQQLETQIESEGD
jgi:ATP-binding cassette subfamily B protein